MTKFLKPRRNVRAVLDHEATLVAHFKGLRRAGFACPPKSVSGKLRPVELSGPEHFHYVRGGREPSGRSSRVSIVGCAALADLEGT